MEKLAEEIADEADKCCYRKGAWKDGIKELALQKLNDVWNAAIEKAAKEIIIPANFELECELAAKIRRLKKERAGEKAYGSYNKGY